MIVVSNKDIFADLGNGNVLIKHKHHVSVVGANLGDVGIKMGSSVINWKTEDGQTTVYVYEKRPDEILDISITAYS